MKIPPAIPAAIKVLKFSTKRAATKTISAFIRILAISPKNPKKRAIISPPVRIAIKRMLNPMSTWSKEVT